MPVHMGAPCAPCVCAVASLWQRRLAHNPRCRVTPRATAHAAKHNSVCWCVDVTAALCLNLLLSVMLLARPARCGVLQCTQGRSAACVVQAGMLACAFFCECITQSTSGTLAPHGDYRSHCSSTVVTSSVPACGCQPSPQRPWLALKVQGTIKRSVHSQSYQSVPSQVP